MGNYVRNDTFYLGYGYSPADTQGHFLSAPSIVPASLNPHFTPIPIRNYGGRLLRGLEYDGKNYWLNAAEGSPDYWLGERARFVCVAPSGDIIDSFPHMATRVVDFSSLGDNIWITSNSDIALSCLTPDETLRPIATSGVRPVVIVAYKGQLWVSLANVGPSQTTLYRLDPESTLATETAAFTDSMVLPGTVRAITADNTYLYALVTDQQAQEKLLQVDSTGAVVRSYDWRLRFASDIAVSGKLMYVYSERVVSYSRDQIITILKLR